MYTIEDFKSAGFMDINSPNNGYFGYLLRCKCSDNEDVSGNFIFMDDGIGCCVRFPASARIRANVRKKWNNGIIRYHDIFIGELFYIKEELAEGYIEFMTSGSLEAIGEFLKDFHAVLMSNIAHVESDGSVIVPLFAVTHTCQLTVDGRMNLPHIHVLWGIKKD